MDLELRLEMGLMTLLLELGNLLALNLEPPLNLSLRPDPLLASSTSLLSVDPYIHIIYPYLSRKGEKPIVSSFAG